MTPAVAIGLELWCMTADVYFDNFVICSEKEIADRWAAGGWGVKKLVASANEVKIFHMLPCFKQLLLQIMLYVWYIAIRKLDYFYYTTPNPVDFNFQN